MMNNDLELDKGQAGEDFVNFIAYQSFLKYWCFPGPLDIAKDYKEICDLLVVFDDICLIVSVKNYTFKGNYERYFNNTIEKAISQIEGAERKLFGQRPIVLKHPDRSEEVFIKETINHVYRIVINLSQDVKYYQTSVFRNSKHFTIMDALAWKSAITEMSTLPDMIQYLTSRCNLFSTHPAFMFPREEYDFHTNDKISAASAIEKIALDGEKVTMVLGSELDLIANYINSGFKFSPELNHKLVNGISMFLDGQWNKYLKSKLSAQKEHFEQESYFIDHLVKNLLINTENGNFLAKLFFRLNRFDRADFARAFLKYHEDCVYGKSSKIKLNRTHYLMPKINMVFIFFDDDFNREDLDDFIALSLTHHHYLHDFKCAEVGALGMSRSGEDFVFGYAKLEDEHSEPEKLEMIKSFKKLGWQLTKIKDMESIK
ncbi:hypothetical protein [Pedobacter frigoris]|uniref:Uncharacterized protein n=1 Tax=Pedobacter frigoris TaxID=2571272 RepID=A0A4U1CC85_9SPHI|nr:hypothetical protein [Pedobacter frigoris]TKC04345.1 hypothetical protein FA047_17325 [Pedobacter frigoris]